MLRKLFFTVLLLACLIPTVRAQLLTRHWHTDEFARVIYVDVPAADPQIPIITRQSINDYQCVPNPGNPPTGYVRFYCDSATGLLTALNSSGASALPSGTPTSNVGTSVISSGLIGDYWFNEGSGTTVLDHSGNNNNGTFGGTGATWLSPVGINFDFHQLGFVSFPSALNSAATIMALVDVRGVNQFTSSPTRTNFVFASNGNGTNTQSAGLGLFTAGTTNNTGIVMPALYGGTGITGLLKQYYAAINGRVVLTLRMISGGSDEIYVNGEKLGTVSTVVSVFGDVTIGNWFLGNPGSGWTASLTRSGFQGATYRMCFYNRTLSPAEIAQNVQAMNIYLGSSSLIPTLPGGAGEGYSADVNPIFLVTGDSITNNLAAQWQSVVPDTNFTWKKATLGITSARASQQAASGKYLAGMAYQPYGPHSAVIFWGGGNDLLDTAPARVLGFMQDACNQLRKEGWNVFPATVMSRTTGGFDANRDTFNTLLRQRWPSFADGLVDIAADPNLGADGAMANPTYSADGTHPTVFAYNNDVIPLFQRVVNRYYGPKDFSSATVYASPAATATATTAGSESGNTATITFGATPANCQAGNIITLAGITPAGYNGNYFILTRTATQIHLLQLRNRARGHHRERHRRMSTTTGQGSICDSEFRCWQLHARILSGFHRPERLHPQYQCGRIDVGSLRQRDHHWARHHHRGGEHYCHPAGTTRKRIDCGMQLGKTAMTIFKEKAT